MCVRHVPVDGVPVSLALIPLLVVDEVGYIPFDSEAANLMFALVSSRYERASMIGRTPFMGPVDLVPGLWTGFVRGWAA